MTEEQAVFQSYLEAKQLKDTAQRRKVLDLFLKTKRHVSAEEMYRELQKRKVRIGFSTVYRTMKLLCHCNLAREVDFGDGRARFEHNHNRRHHDHMICVHCGRTIEFFNATIEKLQDQVAASHSFTVYRHRLEIFGKCGKCDVPVN